MVADISLPELPATTGIQDSNNWSSKNVKKKQLSPINSENNGLLIPWWRPRNDGQSLGSRQGVSTSSPWSDARQIPGYCRPRSVVAGAEKKTAQIYGWDGKLEEEMREIVDVIRRKDKEDYLRLGGKALKLNKFLVISGPVLRWVCDRGLAFHGSWAVVLEHGGEMGMVFQKYRSNTGFFKLVEESIESKVRDEDSGRRENAEVFELNVRLQLGRSLSELRDLAAAAASVEGGEFEEFASKLF
ncbi:UNVERIFIED_CONTAM: putative F-box protein [Sesamum angustifolium]|uniref:F-box protein n=1 Tax=Sesamum angustifolium TaxID=2727405 RepID=A0AAW2KXG4_9LAMI